ncbi:hypothetical protein ACNSOL_12230 (plasmid) [Aliarcobacter lanthieri]|uniref:hypothetical protein n=1 Tax=Aliarcobacter lanthieri TaxID=1355374 RepID=UPI003AAEFC54
MDIKLNKKEIKASLEEILNDCQIISYENTNIYLINDIKFIQIKRLYSYSKDLFNIEIEKIKQKEVGKNKKSKKNNDHFYDFGKILNFSEFPIIAYKPFMKHKYINITDPEKVKKRIEKEYTISKSKLAKSYEELLNANKDSIDEDFIQKIKTEQENKLLDMDEKLILLKTNFQNLDIRITTFTNEVLYPHVRLIDAEGEESISFLRSGVPNILYAHQNLFLLKDGYRKNANHIKFVCEATHAFGEVFYKEK